MSIKTKIEIDGLKELNAALAEISSASARGRVTRAAVSAGARIVRKGAKANARKIKRSGALSKSIAMRVKTNRKTGNTVAVIGPQSKFGMEDAQGVLRIPNLYAKKIEFGSEHAAAQPFLRPALMDNRGSIARVMQERAGTQLAREAAKAAKKGKR